MEQFHRGVVRRQQCQLLNKNMACRSSTYIAATNVSADIYLISRSVSKNDHPAATFSPFPVCICAAGHIRWLVLPELTRHPVCIVMQRAACRGAGPSCTHRAFICTSPPLFSPPRAIQPPPSDEAEELQRSVANVHACDLKYAKPGS